MNQEPTRRESHSLLEWIDQRADDFERDWQNETPPRIQDHLEGLDGERQFGLLEELVRIDIECRNRRGMSRTAEEYLLEFPELANSNVSLFPRVNSEEPRIPVVAESTLKGEDGSANSSSPSVSPSEAGSTPTSTDRYRIVKNLGIGGIGEVFQVEDIELRRPLAMKILRQEFCDDVEVRQRFLEEAQVTSQLQHPGIPPVHDVGQSEDGRPFFVMKLIKGETLTDSDFTPSENESHAWLGMFVSICQTMAYAHSKGVIHRDLKPENIMVGAFGEVQVMDWGLAKIRGQADPIGQQEEERSVVRTERSLDTEGDTKAGSVLGTVRFMAPEQALGRVRTLDERCDVFGLGAILCVLLTGEPPYCGGTSIDEVLEWAQDGNLDDAYTRLEACSADSELVRIAKDCLAVRKEDRPQDAGDVTKRITAYVETQEARRQQAELDQAELLVRLQEQRKRRRLWLSLALVCLVGISLLFYHYRQTREAIQRDIDQAEEHLTKKSWNEARVLLDQAKGRSSWLPMTDLRERLEKTESVFVLVQELDAIRLERSAWIGNLVFSDTSGQRYEQVIRGRNPFSLEASAQEVATIVKRSPVRNQLLTAIDDWAAITADKERRIWLLEVGRLVDLDNSRNRFRNPAIWEDRDSLQQLVDQTAVSELSPELVLMVASRLIFLEGTASELLTKTQRRYPDDFWINFILGVSLMDSQPTKALGYFRVALALRPTAWAVQNNLGLTLYNTGDHETGISHLREAIASQPTYAVPYANLARCLTEQNQKDKAEILLRDLSREAPSLAADVYILLGLDEFDPNNPNLNHLLPPEAERLLKLDAENWVGSLIIALKRLDEGKPDAAMTLLSEPYKAHPENALLGMAVGMAWQAKGDPEKAIPYYQKALQSDLNKLDFSRILRGIQTPEDQAANPDLSLLLESSNFDEMLSAGIHGKLALAYLDLTRYDEAIASSEKAIELIPNEATFYTTLGRALLGIRRFDEGIKKLEKAILLAPNDLTALYYLINWFAGKGRYHEALLQLENALRRLPDNASVQEQLGLLYLNMGQLDKALPLLEKAVLLAPKSPFSQYTFGLTLLELGRLQQGKKALEECKNLCPKNDWYYGVVRTILQRVNNILTLEPKLNKVLEGKAQISNAEEELSLAEYLYFHNQYAQAVDAFQRAFEKKPELETSLGTFVRVHAARAACLVLAGKDKSTVALDRGQQLRYSVSARKWLRADLGDWQYQLSKSNWPFNLWKSNQITSQHASYYVGMWKGDSRLASVRDEGALSKLPQEERECWEQFWTDVDLFLDNPNGVNREPKSKQKNGSSVTGCKVRGKPRFSL